MECRNSKPPVNHSAEKLNLMYINHDMALTKINRMSKQYSVGNDFSVSVLLIIDIINAFIWARVRTM
jgi:hypothetical protein